MKHLFQQLTIRRQLLLCYLSLTIFSLVITTALCFLAAASIIGKKATQYTSETIIQLSENIDHYISQIELTSLSITYNPIVQEFLTDAEQNPSYTRTQLYQLEKSMILTYDYASMRDITLSSPTGTTISVPHPVEEEIPNELPLKAHTASWRNLPAQNLLQMIRYVESAKTYQPIGYLRISMYNGFIHELSRNIDLGTGGFLTVLDDSGEPIFSAEENAFYLKDTQKLFLHDSGDFTQTLDGTRYHYFYKTSEKTGWTSVGVISLNELFKQIIFLGLLILLLLSFIILTIIFISRRLSGFFSNKIQIVLNGMELASNGDFTIQLPVQESTNEFSRLNLGFNTMVAQIKALIDTVYKTQILQKESELKALQAEINPHFLYNTLDTICWQAKLSHNEDIFQTTFSLAALLRASVGNKKTYSSMEEELSYINDYLNIQRVRYRDRISIHISVDSALSSFQIPRLILQPIVENAFVHGLELKRGRGLLSITGIREHSTVIIQIRDNGIGMSQEQIEAVLTSEGAPGSVGLTNVFRRLKLLYGAGADMNISSAPNQGTCVTLRFFES